VALTTDLYARVIEIKEERSPIGDLERLMLSLATSTPDSVRDEQVLSLP
jgi:hypothetical protein